MATAIIAGLASVGSAMIAAGTFAITLGTAFTAFAIGAGLSLVSRALMPKPDLGSQMAGQSVMTREAASSRKIVYGRARVGGNVVYLESTGDDNKYLWLVIAVAGHEIDAYEEVWFNDKKIWDGGSYVNNWGSYVDISFHKGDQTTADSGLVAASTKWTSDHKLLDTAYMVVKLTYDQEQFAQGLPNISTVVRGKKVLDPETSTTAWSQNPALCIYDYLLDSKYGLAESASNILTSSINTAKDVCDETVDLAAGGTQPRYTMDGVIDTANSIKSNIENMTGAMIGRLVYSGGKFEIHAGEYVAPTVTIDESMMVGEISVQTKQSRRNAYNGVKGVFLSEEDNYILADYPAQISSTYATQDGDPVYLDMPLPYTVNNVRAQRIAKLALLRSRQQEAITIPCNLNAFKFKIGDNINVSNTRLGYSSKVFEVVGYSFGFSNDQMVVNVEAIETASSIWDWTTSDEEVFLGAGEVDLYDGSFTERPASISVSADSYMGEDGTFYPFFNVTWPASVDAFVDHYVLEWKKTTDSDYFDQVVEQSPSRIVNLENGVTYNVRVKAVNSLGVYSSPTADTQTVATDTTAPSAPSSVSASGEFEQITINWTNPTVADFSHVDVYRSTSSSGTYALIGKSAGTNFTDTNLAVGVTRYYKLRAVDYSGNATKDGSGNPVYSSIVNATTTQVPSGGIADNAVDTDQIADDAVEGAQVDSATTILVGSGANTAAMSGSASTDLDYRFWAGAQTPSSASFTVDESGAVVARDITIVKADGSVVFNSTDGFTDEAFSEISTITGTAVTTLANPLTDDSDLESITLTETTTLTVKGKLNSAFSGFSTTSASDALADIPDNFTIKLLYKEQSASSYTTIATQAYTKTTGSPSSTQYKVLQTNFGYGSETFYNAEIAASSGAVDADHFAVLTGTITDLSGTSSGTTYLFKTEISTSDSSYNSSLNKVTSSADRIISITSSGAGFYLENGTGSQGAPEGDITAVTAGTNLTGGGTSGAVTLNLDNNISLNNLTLTGYLRAPSTFTIDPATHGDDTGTLVIAGNLQVDGTQTTVNSTVVEISDLNFKVAKDAANASAANGAGLTVGGADAQLKYIAVGDKWTMNKDLDVSGSVTATGGNSTNWNTAYTYSQVGHLPLSGGTLTGNLTIPEYIFHSGDTDTSLRFTDDAITLRAGAFDTLKVTPDDVNIVKTLDLDPANNTYAINAKVDYTTGASTNRGIFLDFNVSGNDAATVDHVHSGLHIDADSSYTGGDTSNEGRLYGAYVQATSSGDNDYVYGGRFFAQTSGTDSNASTVTSNVVGLEGYADQNRALANTAMYGTKGLTYVDNAGATGTVNCNAAYGIYGKHTQHTGGTSGTTTTATGVYGEVEVAEGTVTTAYGVRSVIDHNAGTIGTGYLFKGAFTGTIGTKWGIHTVGASYNQISGTFRSDDGVASNPTYSFNSDTNTGMYSVSDNVIGFSTNGSQRLKIENTGIEVNGAVVADSLNISGTSNLGSVDIYDSGSNAVVAADSGHALELRGRSGQNVNVYAHGALNTVFNSTGIDVTGTATMDSLTTETSGGGIITLSDTVASAVGGEVAGQLKFVSADESGGNTPAIIKGTVEDAYGRVGLTFITGTGTPVDRMKISKDGDISFYEDTGTTAKFFWDASAESLGIGTSSPTSYNSNGQTLVLSGSGNTGMSIVSGTSSNSSIMFADGTGGTAGYRGHIKYNHADDSLNFATAATASRLVINSSGNATFSGSVTATADTDALNIFTTNNGAGADICFSDHATTASRQCGYLRYVHSNTASYGSGNAFILDSTESTTTILADGKLMFKEGLYLKPSSGTGAGTQIISSSGNISNIGTINSGAITSTSSMNAAGGYYVSGTEVVDASRNLKNISGLYFPNANSRIYGGGSYRALEPHTNGSQLQLGEGYGLINLFKTQNAPNELKLYNNRQDAGNVEVSKVSGYNSVEVANMTFYRGGGGASGYIRFQNKPTNASSLTDVFQVGNGSTVGYGVDILAGGLRVGGTTVIDSSRNLTNIGTISSGFITSSGSAGSQYAGSFTNTSSQGWGLFVKAGADSADYSLRVQNKDSANLLAVKSDGSIGIGTSSPSRQLHLSNSSDHGIMAITGGTSSLAGVVFGDTADDDVSGIIHNNSGNYLYFNTSSTERMRIFSDGDVSIGMTANYAKLNVNGHVRAENSAFLAGREDAANPAFAFHDDTDTGMFNIASNILAFATGGSERMRIDSSGAVGFKKTPPSGSHTSWSQLFIGEKGTLISESTNSSGLYGTWLTDNMYIKQSTGAFANVTTDQSSAYKQEAGIHHWYSQASGSADAAITLQERMRIDSSGNLLVGKTSLDVATVGQELRASGYMAATRDGSTVGSYTRLSSDGTILEFRKDGSTVGSIGTYGGYGFINGGNSGGTHAGLRFINNASIRPCNNVGNDLDNTLDLGHTNARFDDIYATNGTIQTSDRNEKQDIAELSEAEQRVAVAAKGLLRKFRWKDSVAEKGDDARIHFGIIAQDLQAAFEAEGLDAGDYAMFISTTWTDEETNEEKTRMGVRYSELLAFIISAI